MKKLLILLLFLLIVGCSNKVEVDKNDYLKLKKNLEKQEIYTLKDELPCDINFYLKRLNDEVISYTVIIDNPKENMNNIKALVIHNYYTEDIFPSSGIFEEKESLIVGSEKVKGITLGGYIDTIKDINELNLNIKVFIEYENDLLEKKTIFYSSTEF